MQLYCYQHKKVNYFSYHAFKKFYIKSINGLEQLRATFNTHCQFSRFPDLYTQIFYSTKYLQCKIPAYLDENDIFAITAHN